MKLARTAALVFAVVVLCGGYGVHQYMLFHDAESFALWDAMVRPVNIALGWLLLLLALVFGFVKSEEEAPE